MDGHPTPLKPCPTPGKWRYRSPGEAMAGVPFNKATRPHHPYLCCCGWYHITSHPPGGRRQKVSEDCYNISRVGKGRPRKEKE